MNTFLPAYQSNDYSYVNHFGKRVCFNFKFEKRVKTKVLEFLKTTHEEAKIIKFLNELDLKIINSGDSKKYKHYDIVEK